MNNNFDQINLLPIPWMKQKLESIYEKKFCGDLFLFFSNLRSSTKVNPKTITDLLDNLNIVIDNTHPIYFYFPTEVNDFINDLIITLKSLFPNNAYIILCGFKEIYISSNNMDYIANLCDFYPHLRNKIDGCCLIDSSKSFEIFTSLSDTQRINILPNSSCTISCPILDYKFYNINICNLNHVCFVELIEDKSSNFTNYYIKGLTNKNNNFNFNF
ncbi:hypothetical protein [Romboutsia sp. 1001713B170207_170306_H8]|uniref:hypothetical protein n=1 Tax=Romboutsia sp. 1001713B170207_170306_H8 TaxID=2787112 RepID=UPI0008214285|nr:hypothetical protein [Romboutsia sp. 1001713B170207_170306_H8]SCH38334.1 Uncharacterised protein [uncultured Clostridium sp.]